MTNLYWFSYSLSFRKSQEFCLCEFLPRARECSASLERPMLKTSCPSCISLIWKEQGLIIGNIFIYLLLLQMFSRKACPTLCDPMGSACQASLSLISWSVPKFMSIESVMLSNYLILCHSLLLLLSVFPRIKISSNKSAVCIRWPKYWSFSNSPFIEYLELISFKTDWFDFLAFQGTLKSLLKHHNPVLSLLYDLTLTSIHDYWKDHSFDYTNLCWQADVFAFIFSL